MAAGGPCCPSGSEPLRVLSLPEPGGEVVAIDGLVCYVARPSGSPRGGVLMFTDIFGMRSGRHMQLCDLLAEKGFLAVCPDFFGEDLLVQGVPQFGFGFCAIMKFLWAFMSGSISQWMRRHNWETKLQPDVMQKVVPWMKAQGVQSLASIGFCWGAYGVARCSSTGAFACGLQFHPSTEKVCESLGEDDLELCRQVKCPQLVVATSMESAKWKPGGAVETAVAAVAPQSRWILERRAMHGYMSRGDPTDPKTAEALSDGLALMEEFLEKHVTR